MGSPNDLLKEVVARVGAAASAVAEFSKEMAFELRLEGQEAARTGFGVPRAVTSLASLGCFAVAAAGTASITMDFVKKFYGARECDGCSGWEALTCRSCRGTGKTSTSTSASDSAAGGASQCGACSGTGVVKCSTCGGNAWKPKLTMDRILDSPAAGWDAYRMCQPVSSDSHQIAIRELVLQSVATLPVPPRPADWAQAEQSWDLEQSVREAAGQSQGPIKVGRARVSLEEELRRARVVKETVLDAAWATEWRGQQVKEILQEMNQGLAKARKIKQTPKPKVTEGAPATGTIAKQTAQQGTTKMK